jgi:hypothetical protein
MEVHHHPDVHHKKKNFKEYFLEFLMIFLAVTLGFFAESIRENIADREREKQYMQSMIGDLKSDTATLASNIYLKQSRIVMIDSLIYLLSSANYKVSLNDIYYYGRSISPPANFSPNDRTIQQLKSSGGLRLIRNVAVSDSIMAYDQEMRLQIAGTEDEYNIRLEYRKAAIDLFDGKVFNSMLTKIDRIEKPQNNPELFKADAVGINSLIGNAQYLKKNDQLQIVRETELKKQATELIEMIQKEYHLGNE